MEKCKKEKPDMKAVILAAGIGSRLRPLTEDIPKCLVKINKKTILEQIIENCTNLSINKFVVVVGHGETFVVEKINDLRSTDVIFELIRNKNYLTTNTSASLNLGLRNLDEDVIIINGDNVFDQDILKKLIKTDDTAIVIDNVKQLLKESFKVRINEVDGRIGSMGKNIPVDISNGEFIGISLIKRKDLDIFKKILQKIVSENEQQYYDFAFQEFTNIKPINFVYTDHLKWTEVDDFEDLEYAKKIAEEICLI